MVLRLVLLLLVLLLERGNAVEAPRFQIDSGKGPCGAKRDGAERSRWPPSRKLICQGSSILSEIYSRYDCIPPAYAELMSAEQSVGRIEKA